MALAGALGTLARYFAAVALLPVSKNLPWGTIVVNITGAFVIGFFGTLTLAHGRYPVPENLRLVVMVGFCGGFTTFSAFSLQTLDLLRKGAVGAALLNIGLSVALCLCSVAAGHYLAAHFNGGAAQVAQRVMEEES